MDLTVIRPMMFIDEMEVIGFRNKYSLPVVKGKCPVDGHTKRQYAKELLRELNKEHPGTKERMFHAILTGDIKGWPAAHDIETLNKILKVNKLAASKTHPMI